MPATFLGTDCPVLFKKPAALLALLWAAFPNALTFLLEKPPALNFAAVTSFSLLRDSPRYHCGHRSSAP